MNLRELADMMADTHSGLGFSVMDMLDKLDAIYIQKTEELRGMFGPKIYVDEVALLFADPDALAIFVQNAVRQDRVELFNTARDQVYTEPLVSRYEVDYWFLSTEKAYRIEAMVPTVGSPLHTTVAVNSRMRHNEALPVHASFKCPDEESYTNATATLTKNGYECAQRCRSAYGRFSYWTPLATPTDGVFLKPRMNERDS